MHNQSNVIVRYQVDIVYQSMVLICWQTLLLLTSYEFNLVSQAFFFFCGGWYDNCSWGKRWSLSWSILDGHVASSSCKGFWVDTLASGQVFSSMC
jgi:hypothetical protein